MGALVKNQGILEAKTTDEKGSTVLMHHEHQMAANNVETGIGLCEINAWKQEKKEKVRAC